MENASKALLIAGAILICILLIAIGMYIYNSAQGTIQTAAGQMGQKDKEMYNSMIRKYVGNSKKGSDVKQMIEDVISQNSQYVNESGKFISIHAGNISGYTTSKQDPLKSVCEAANVYESQSGENNQKNIDAARAEYRKLEQKISAGRNYKVEEKEKDGIIYMVTVSEYEESTKASTNP